MDYSVAVSGLAAAYAGMDTIGNNIANASTEGYHCQRVELAPSSNGATENTAGSGVDVAGITRIDQRVAGERNPQPEIVAGECRTGTVHLEHGGSELR